MLQLKFEGFSIVSSFLILTAATHDNTKSKWLAMLQIGSWKLLMCSQSQIMLKNNQIAAGMHILDPDRA